MAHGNETPHVGPIMPGLGGVDRAIIRATESLRKAPLSEDALTDEVIAEAIRKAGLTVEEYNRIAELSEQSLALKARLH